MFATETAHREGRHAMTKPRTFTLRRFTREEDVPMAEAKALLLDHAHFMHSRMVGAGGPDFDIHPHLDAFWSNLDAVLPPNGSYYLAFDLSGKAVGTGALKRLSPSTGEMKHLFVRPEMRRSGLGQALVEARIRDAREMGLTELVADTFSANHEQPALYQKMGFEELDIADQASTSEITPELVPFLRFFRMSL